MALTVAQALQAGRVKLGVKASDPEFPVSTLLPALQAVVGELHLDLVGIASQILEGSTTLVADAADSHVYTLSAQASPVTIAHVLSLRLDDRRGAKLDQATPVQLDDYRGARYSLTGVPGAQVIETSESLPSGRPLFLRYIAPVPTLTEGGSIPAWIGDQYLDVLGLMIAEQTYSQGGEQQFPTDQARLLARRKDALWDYWAAQNPDPLMRADTGDGIAPYLF